MKQPEVAGFIIGLVALVLALILLISGKIPDLGQWWIPIGTLAIIIILCSYWKVTRTWLLPALFGAAILLIVVNYLLTKFLVPDAQGQDPLVGLAVFGIIVDGAVLILLAAALVLQIRGLITWFRERE